MLPFTDVYPKKKKIANCRKCNLLLLCESVCFRGKYEMRHLKIHPTPIRSGTKSCVRGCFKGRKFWFPVSVIKCIFFKHATVEYFTPQACRTKYLISMLRNVANRLKIPHFYQALSSIISISTIDNKSAWIKYILILLAASLRVD